MTSIRSLIATAIVAASLFTGCTSAMAPESARPEAVPAPVENLDAVNRDGIGAGSDLCVAGPHGAVCVLGANSERAMLDTKYVVTPATSDELVVDSTPIAGPDEEGGLCGDLINDPSLPAFDQEAADLFDAFITCACGECAAACGANYCTGADPDAACKACLVTTPVPASTMPETAAVVGCYSQFYACADDVGPPDPPFVCSEAFPDAPSCGMGYTGVYPLCDFITVVDFCVYDGDLYCPEGYIWATCCTEDDTTAGGICVPDTSI